MSKSNGISSIIIFLSKIIILVFISIFLIFLFLVRFTDFSIGYQGRRLIGYNEESKKWIFNDWEVYSLAGYDGPYLFSYDEKIEEINVIKNSKNQYVLDKKIHNSIPEKFICQIDCEEGSFYFNLQKNIIIDSAIYKIPPKIIAISDIEGNYNAFYSFLFSNKVIDRNHNWIFNDGHLVLLGDFMDRGQNVTQIVWLIYKLEQEAATFGGKVHFILGNHEIMNINGQTGYLHKKYKALAQHYTGKKNYKAAYQELVENNLLINWLSTKNVAVIIGNYLFVHAGISPELFNLALPIESINKIVRQNNINSENNELILGRMGPLWYRGIVRGYKDIYAKISENELNKILNYYEVDKMVIGHTIVDDISYDFDCKVLRIDVKHGENKFSGKTLGIFIENDSIYKIDDLGNKFQIHNMAVSEKPG